MVYGTAFALAFAEEAEDCLPTRLDEIFGDFFSFLLRILGKRG
jgi:hypothetical protein